VTIIIIIIIIIITAYQCGTTLLLAFKFLVLVVQCSLRCPRTRF